MIRITTLMPVLSERLHRVAALSAIQVVAGDQQAARNDAPVGEDALGRVDIVVEIAPGRRAAGTASGTTAMLSFPRLLRLFRGSAVAARRRVHHRNGDQQYEDRSSTLKRGDGDAEEPRTLGSPTIAGDRQTIATETLAPADALLVGGPVLVSQAENIGISPIGLTITTRPRRSLLLGEIEQWDRSG